MPVHLGAMPFSVAAAVEAFPPETLAPGDSVLLNDPFRGGAHLPDLTLVTPVYDEAGEELLAFAANRAHHADIGGSTAGSVAADSTEIYQEGLRIPPVRFESGGEVREDVLSMILANVRTPEERRGDLRAQTAANATGRRRFQEVAAAHGDDLAPALEEIKDYSERRMRAEIRDLPDGTYQFGDVLDDDGRGNEDLPVEVAVEVDGDSVVVDFEGTAAQTDGPINAVFAVTASATYYAVRCVTDPDIPPNHGCYRPIDIRAPEGTIVNPDLPAAVVGGNLETSQRVTDAVLGALAEADPGAVVAACQGTMNNVTFGGTDPRTGGPYAFYETQGGGFGGRATGDGMDGVHVHMSNTMNTPAEVLETAYPLRVERYAYRPDSGGAGEFRGGLGLRRDIRVRDHTARFSLLAERHESHPYGLVGGGPGANGAAYLVNDDGEELETLAAKHTDPDDRDPDAIARDLRLGKLTPAAARERYGYDPEDPDSDDRE
jgi:N-methylhydantoinase B